MRYLQVAAVLVGTSVAIIGADQQPIFRAGVDVVRIDVSVMSLPESSTGMASC